MNQASRAPTAAIIVIGDEVLSGKVEELNARFLVRELRALGVAVRRIEVVPDLREEIAAAVRKASVAFDHVFTTGGIGPTHDDVTIAAIAAAFAVPVVRDSGLADLIREVSGERFFERDLRMADVPEGADLIRGEDTRHSRWPVIAIRNVYVLPGVQASILLLLVAFILDLVKRDDARGTWQESHFSWRIRTVLWAAFWYLATSWLWILLFVPGYIAWGVISIWFLYRVVKGWSNLNANRAMPA